MHQLVGANPQRLQNCTKRLLNATEFLLLLIELLLLYEWHLWTINNNSSMIDNSSINSSSTCRALYSSSIILCRRALQVWHDSSNSYPQPGCKIFHFSSFAFCFFRFLVVRQPMYARTASSRSATTALICESVVDSTKAICLDSSQPTTCL